MPRRRTGTLIPRKDGGYSAKITTADGQRLTIDLGTRVRSLALRRLRERAEAAEPPPKRAVAETFEHAAERVHEARKRDEIVSEAQARTEFSRLRRWAFPEFGAVPVDRVEPAHVNEALDKCKADGRSRSTCAQLLFDIRNVFKTLVREGAVTANPTNHDAVALPRFKSEAKRERAVLTDEEFVAYVRWEHPLKEHRHAMLERQVMAYFARVFGGIRTGDLHALRWQDFDLPDGPDAAGGFEWGWAPRQKTRQPQRLKVPEEMWYVLRIWWEACGHPRGGLLFGARKPSHQHGDRKGEEKRSVSYARSLRRDLRRAWGIDVWHGDSERGEFRQARPLTDRERTVLEGDARTLPVDFHSFRRWYAQALADVGLSAQQAQVLAGHSTLGAHAVYLRRSGKAATVPEDALPRIFGVFRESSTPRTKPADDDEDEDSQPSETIGVNDGTRTRDNRSHSPVLCQLSYIHRGDALTGRRSLSARGSRRATSAIPRKSRMKCSEVPEGARRSESVVELDRVRRITRGRNGG